MLTHSGKSSSSPHRMQLPSPSRQGLSRRSQTGAVIITLIAIYGLVYAAVRISHRTADGRVTIETGSRIANRAFAPAIGLEKFLRSAPEVKAILFEDALMEAQKTDRPILVVLGTKNCLPCRQLEQFLQDQRGILSRYFVFLKANIDDPSTPGLLIRDRYRHLSDSEGYTNYFPWIAFIDGDGSLLVTGDDDADGLIGIPHGGPQDREWFLRMLRIANPKITEDELAMIDVAGADYHKFLWRK
jgi:thioredoxin-related protein